MLKTNVMRILDKEKIEYEVLDYTSQNLTNGEEIAAFLGESPLQVFKTLVTIGKSKEHYVFIINVSSELDLKKCAIASNEKNIELIHQKELLPLTGYIHGGCSPLGMKKQFKTFIDSSCYNFDHIFISGGKVGYQIKIDPKQLIKIANISVCDLAKL
jgi:Cys-tRNA(Pro)/Cys-tRNA(Cys) deacylase